MKPVWNRLVPAASELVEVRWVMPTHRRGDIMVRRFRRPADAVRFAEKLRDRKGVRDVRVWHAPVGRWRELPLAEVRFVYDDERWGW